MLERLQPENKLLINSVINTPALITCWGSADSDSLMYITLRHVLFFCCPQFFLWKHSEQTAARHHPPFCGVPAFSSPDKRSIWICLCVETSRSLRHELRSRRPRLWRRLDQEGGTVSDVSVRYSKIAVGDSNVKRWASSSALQDYKSLHVSSHAVWEH